MALLYLSWYILDAVFVERFKLEKALNLLSRAVIWSNYTLLPTITRGESNIYARFHLNYLHIMNALHIKSGPRAFKSPAFKLREMHTHINKRSSLLMYAAGWELGQTERKKIN